MHPKIKTAFKFSNITNTLSPLPSSKKFVANRILIALNIWTYKNKNDVMHHTIITITDLQRTTIYISKYYAAKKIAYQRATAFCYANTTLHTNRKHADDKQHKEYNNNYINQLTFSSLESFKVNIILLFRSA